MSHDVLEEAVSATACLWMLLFFVACFARLLFVLRLVAMAGRLASDHTQQQDHQRLCSHQPHEAVSIHLHDSHCIFRLATFSTVINQNFLLLTG